jgi:hypothetical protein
MKQKFWIVSFQKIWMRFGVNSHTETLATRLTF